MTIKGIVFDKDGTLFDFNKTWGPITKTLIEGECGGDINKISRLADTLGYDMKVGVFRPGSLVIAETSETVADAILPFTQDGDKAALIDRMSKATTDVEQVHVADLESLFRDLRQRDLRLGIATNDAETSAKANLLQAGVHDQFDFIAGFDSGFGAKPETGQLLAFSNHVNLPTKQCVMVGDSLHDLMAGRAADMRTIGVLTGPALRSELSPFADVVLETIAEIPAWLDSL